MVAPAPKAHTFASAAWDDVRVRALTATLIAPKTWRVEVENEGLTHTVIVKRQGRTMVGVHENRDSARVARDAVQREQPALRAAGGGW